MLNRSRIASLGRVARSAVALAALSLSVTAGLQFGMSSARPVPVASGTSTVTAALTAYQQHFPGQDIPVIVQTKGDPTALEAQVLAAGGHIKAHFGVLRGFSATVRAGTALALANDSAVRRLNLDAPVRLLGSAVDSSSLVNRYESISRVQNAWQAGLDGSEVQVAVIDSGVYPHDDLTRKSASVPGNGGNRLVALTTNAAATDAIDHVGHGTHVAGIIAGNGYDSGGQYIGVAPNSLLVSVKVSDDAGNTSEGDVITGLEWVYQANQHGMHIKVANLSLASTVAMSYNDSALDAMAEKLWASGVLVVASSGNGSGAPQYAPGNDPFVLTVGSIDDNYQGTAYGSSMAPWSPYGNTQDGFAKPEVVADGSHVVSLLAPGGTLASDHPANVVSGNYFKMGGTSMAAPQVTGMAALILQRNPSYIPNRVKQLVVRDSKAFSSVAYTNQLGTWGGLLDYVATTDGSNQRANGGIPWSRAFDIAHAAINVGGTWVGGATFPGASWNSTSWNSTSWNSTSWNSTSWNGTAFASTSWNSTSWNSTSWNSTSWNSTSWNSTSWNSTSWNSTSWNSTSWNSTSWNDADFS